MLLDEKYLRNCQALLSPNSPDPPSRSDNISKYMLVIHLKKFFDNHLTFFIDANIKGLLFLFAFHLLFVMMNNLPIFVIGVFVKIIVRKYSWVSIDKDRKKESNSVFPKSLHNSFLSGYVIYPLRGCRSRELWKSWLREYKLSGTQSQVLHFHSLQQNKCKSDFKVFKKYGVSKVAREVGWWLLWGWRRLWISRCWPEQGRWL